MSTYSLDRTNAKNTGRSFEREMELTCTGYEQARIATISKVAPPTRTVGGGRNMRAIYLSNPFLDFIGIWTAKGERPLMIEAKSTSKHLLPIGADGGLTANQCVAMERWEQAGAIVVLVWQFNHQVVAIRSPQRKIPHPARSLRFEDFKDQLVERGHGYIVWDFLSKI
jgi:penicillin-binding protein-related factor A (putative recombinase)